ncbi:MAG: hypothetical protein IPP48_11860 [Chitinophagaceae bacterium]|nr:hypothetical protein [Chitinophagaceae bacterium]
MASGEELQLSRVLDANRYAVQVSDTTVLNIALKVGVIKITTYKLYICAKYGVNIMAEKKLPVTLKKK